MISKHIDLLAVAALLLAMAMFSGARHMVFVALSGPASYIRLNGGHSISIAPPAPEAPPAAPVLQQD